MNPYQLIDSLCSIASLQADIIRRQQAIIMQHGIEVEDPTLEQSLESVESSLDEVEMKMRKI